MELRYKWERGNADDKNMLKFSQSGRPRHICPYFEGVRFFPELPRDKIEELYLCTFCLVPGVEGEDPGNESYNLSLCQIFRAVFN